MISGHPFFKYQGTGNDFILIDDRKRTFSTDPALLARLCHRKWGIGADGLILLQSSLNADFRMRIFNSDGYETESCGNGLCCLMRFLLDLKCPSKTYLIEMSKGKVKIEMDNGKPAVFLQDPKELRLSNELVLENGEKETIHFINTGVPHAVIFTNELAKTEVVRKGKEIRWHPIFSPEGANVNFAQIGNDRTVDVRTYERGVENETLACGTGATAVALIAHELHHIKSPIAIRYPGGIVTISFEKSSGKWSKVKLIGSATFVFSGQIP